MGINYLIYMDVDIIFVSKNDVEFNVMIGNIIIKIIVNI